MITSSSLLHVGAGQIELGLRERFIYNLPVPEDLKTKLRLEIAHVLFIDIVGYSKAL